MLNIFFVNIISYFPVPFIWCKGKLSHVYYITNYKSVARNEVLLSVCFCFCFFFLVVIFECYHLIGIIS